MKYRIKKETKPKLPTYGKYKAVAVHEQTITSEQIIQEAAELHILSEGVITAVVMRRDWGLMKLEIESDKVDNLRDFRAKKHIRGVRLHFIPESNDGTQALYDGITFKKDVSL